MSEIKKIPDWVQDLLSDEEGFWNVIYTSYSVEQKVKHWSGSLHRQMRMQVESGLDPYAIYGSGWYNDVKKVEPNIDQIMDEVFSKYWSTTGGEWSKEEYLKRIH